MLSSTENVAKSSPILDRKIEEATVGLSASYAKQLHSICEDNAGTIIDYITAMKSEVNLSDHYRKDLIELLCRFSKYNDNKPFKDLIRIDIIAFLDTFRRPEPSDPLHKWIGTYNVFRIHLLRFFNNSKEQTWTVSKTVCLQIIEQLRKGLTVIKVTRNGTDRNTTYNIEGVQ